MKKLLFVFLGFFVLTAFTDLNQEELDKLSANLEDIKETQSIGDYDKILTKLRQLFEQCVDDKDLAYSLNDDLEYYLKTLRGMGKKIPGDVFWSTPHNAECPYNRILIKTVIEKDGIEEKDIDQALFRFIELKDIVKLLLEKRANPNAVPDNMTPLMWVAVATDISQKEIIEIVDILLSYGADIDATDNFGRHAYDYAFRWNNLEAAKYLYDKLLDAHDY